MELISFRTFGIICMSDFAYDALDNRANLIDSLALLCAKDSFFVDFWCLAIKLIVGGGIL